MIPDPVRVLTDDRESLGALLGSGLVLTAGDGLPDVGGGVRVHRADAAHDGRVVWRDAAFGAALVAVDRAVGSTRVRWGVLPAGARVPCSVLTGDGPVRTALVSDGDGITADTRDIDHGVTGAALVCGDLLLGVVLPGLGARVLAATALLAFEEFGSVLTDHRLSSHADLVGTAVPADTDVDLARGRLRAVVVNPPPSDPAECARLTDTCLGLARALPNDSLVAAASSVERPGPLHAALDRLIADSGTPLEVLVDLMVVEVRGLEAWAADMYAVVARRLDAADVSSDDEAARAEGTVVAYHLAARSMGRQRRLAASSDAVAALRAYLRELPDDDHDRYRGFAVKALGQLAADLLDAERLQEAERVLSDLVDSYVATVERGAVESRSHLIEALNARTGVLAAIGRPAEALRSATDAVRVCEQLRATAPDSHTQDLAVAHAQRAIFLRSLGREDEAVVAEAFSREIQEQRSESPTDPAMSIILLTGRGKEHTAAGRHAQALEAFTEAVRLIRAGGVRDSPGRTALGGALMFRSEALFRTGRKEEALETSAEACDVARNGAVNPAGPGSFLMSMLARRARLLYAMGRASALLAVTTEIADLAGQADPGAFGGVLAPQRTENAVLRVFALRFLGRHREALEAAEAALGLIADLPSEDAVRNWESAMRREREAMETALEEQGEGSKSGPGTSLSANSVTHLNADLFDLALGLASEAIEILRSSGRGEPDALEALARAHVVRARVHSENEAFEAVIADAEAALHLMRNGAEGAAPEFLNSVLRTRGWALIRLERWDEAVPALVESVASTRAEVERGGVLHMDLAHQVGLLARAYIWSGRHHDALPHAAEAVALDRSVVESGDEDPDTAGELLGRHLIFLAFALWKVGDAEAVAVAEEAVRILEGLGERTPVRDKFSDEARQLLDLVRDPGGSAAD